MCHLRLTIYCEEILSENIVSWFTQSAIIMYSTKLCVALLLLWASSVYSATSLGAYFQVCRQSNKDLAGCLKNSLTNAVSTIVKGIPALGLPSIEPLTVPSIEMKDKYGVLSFQQTLTNLNINGMTKYQIKSVKVDQAKDTVQLVINSPSIQLDGHYNMDVKIVLLPVKGSGDCKMSFTNVESTIDIAIEKYASGGQNRYRIKSLNWSIDPETATFSFNSLGDAVNKFINSNWKLAFNIYKQIPEEAFGSLLRDQVNTVLARYTADEIYPA